MLAAVVAVGCGGGDEEETATAGSAAGAGEGGVLTWALAARPTEIDPLHARGASGQLVSRQIHEPLGASVTPPFDEGGREPGVARSVLPSRDATVWRVRLREGVRFQDGSPLNAGVVLANADRWRDSAGGRRALPDFLADGPRPDLVRFILSEPDPNFGERLAAPQFGLVSPRALRRGSDSQAFPMQLAGTGTGPFELRETEPDRVLLARNTDWWGADVNLGPALDQLEFTAVDGPGERLAILRAGTVRVASGLEPGQLNAAREDALLTVVGGPGAIAAERSVRGLDPGEGRAPLLNDVWVTGIGPG